MPVSPNEARSPRSTLHPSLPKPKAPRVYRYVVTHDSGFAPCFESGVCTLACCKPNIRRSAVEGDWVLGFAPRKQGDAQLLYAMRVGEVLDFKSYAKRARFRRRRDNIYQPNGSGGFRRVAAHDTHSDPRSQARDLRGCNVLIADQWWHFEVRGLDLLVALDDAVARRLWYPGRGHKINGLEPGDLQAIVDTLRRKRGGHAGIVKVESRQKGTRPPRHCG
jgi:hypothetical protein